MPSVAILGASEDRKKFGNRAVRAFANQGYTVYPVHPKAKVIEGLRVYPSILDIPVSSVDKVSVYLAPEIGITLLEQILKKKPKELWLNPGAESAELINKAKALGLNVIAACSIVAIGENPSS